MLLAHLHAHDQLRVALQAERGPVGIANAALLRGVSDGQHACCLVIAGVLHPEPFLHVIRGYCLVAGPCRGVAGLASVGDIQHQRPPRCTCERDRQHGTPSLQHPLLTVAPSCTTMPHTLLVGSWSAGAPWLCGCYGPGWCAVLAGETACLSSSVGSDSDSRQCSLQIPT